MKRALSRKGSNLVWALDFLIHEIFIFLRKKVTWLLFMHFQPYTVLLKKLYFHIETFATQCHAQPPVHMTRYLETKPGSYVGI